MLYTICLAYLFCSFLTAWLISYGLQDEEYGGMLHMALRIDDSRPLYETFRLLFTAPLVVWFGL